MFTGAQRERRMAPAPYRTLGTTSKKCAQFTMASVIGDNSSENLAVLKNKLIIYT